MHDLAQAFIAEGHQVTFITPTSTQKERVHITCYEGVRLVQVKAFETKDINYVSRILAEFINPFLIWHKLKKSPEFLNTQYDGIIWYSPTIFWGPLIKRLKQQYGVRTYLILRDIFPDWALDLGLIKKGIIYKFLKAVEFFQYQQADVIGVQSPNNLTYFKGKNSNLTAEIEVLWNWIGETKEIPCSIDLSKTILAGRKICVYAGNMGPAQAVQNLVSLAEMMRDLNDIGFVFVGRGSEVEYLKTLVQRSSLDNCLFFNEIDSAEIPGLLRQCAVGMISLDSRHRAHNIPGKFLSYIKAGIPVMGFVNTDNDLCEIVSKYNLGKINDQSDVGAMFREVVNFSTTISNNNLHADRCAHVYRKYFSSHKACSSILSSLCDARPDF
jgi:glycosyltransferase involved in cell wall biosynthesis